jgi:hypothetical protein
MKLEEMRRSYLLLSETLASLGLAWVVHQVEETIKAGKTVPKETRIVKDDEQLEQAGVPREQPTAPRRPGKPTLMMTSEPWDEADQLLFLIDGVRQAIVEAAHIENEQLRLLRALGKVKTVQFESDEGATERFGLKLAGQTDERIEALGKLLDALEKEVRE